MGNLWNKGAAFFLFICVPVFLNHCSNKTETGVLSDNLQSTETIPRGVLAPIGGGATQADDSSTVKESQKIIFARLKSELVRQRQRFESIPEGFCLVSYTSNSSAELDIETGPMRSLLEAAGVPKDLLFAYSFSTRESSQDFDRVKDFKNNCGLVYLPGGDQSEQVSLWSGSLFQKSLVRLYDQGGILAGKSAGAAILGRWVFTPEANRDPVVSEFLGDSPLARRELQKEPVVEHGPNFPDLLFETHTGDRERAARGAVFLAELNQRIASPQTAQQGGLGNKVNFQTQFLPVVVALDSDTGVLLRAAGAGRWSLETVGYRSVEVLSFVSTSRTRVSPVHSRRFEISGGRTDLLESGDTLILSDEGMVLAVEGARDSALSGQKLRNLEAIATKGAALKKCWSSTAGETVEGNNLEHRELFSSSWFSAVASPGSKEQSIEEIDYAYLLGLARVKPGNGCGLWLTGAFDPDSGHPENRLNLLRYGLALGLADVGFSLSQQTNVKMGSNGNLHVGGPSPSSSSSNLSLFVLDVVAATGRKVSRSVYSDLGASGPLQTGRWTDGRFHLLAPGSSLAVRTSADDSDADSALKVEAW